MRGMEIMRTNMYPIHVARGLEWNQDGIHRHFESMANYSIWNGTGWRGFVSLEWCPESLFIHTLQVAPGFQGGPTGAGVFRVLQSRCRERGIDEIHWSAFRGSEAAGLYQKLGLRGTPENTHLLHFVYRFVPPHRD
jgi:hypothetical protein